MKKLLILTTVGAMLAAPAMAVQKCVALDSSTTTCTSTAAYGKADWSATCTTNDTSVPIKGIAMCSNQAVASAAPYSTSDAITTASSATETTNVNCWCKMVEPAVSPWLFLASYTSAGNCAYICSYFCANVVQGSSTYRSALFGSLAN
ncbi:MAG: hypothetical protein IJD41_00200 [Alphaproteobacteria bacterium]|nr:hypothetical protein [Alphaproteobacteria bacterium]